MKPSRTLKEAANFVLASFRPLTYPRGYASALRSLRPCWTSPLNVLGDGYPTFPSLHTAISSSY
jgi:hypothetical protein